MASKRGFNIILGAGLILFFLIGVIVMVRDLWQINRKGVYTIGKVIELGPARRGIYIKIQFSLDGRQYVAEADAGEWEEAALGVDVMIRVQRDNPEGYFEIIREGKVSQCVDTVPRSGWVEIPSCMGIR